MINKLRKFSTTRAAQVIVVIIIIPFVFWGMGGVFSGGNTNNIVKINNHNITTQDFMDHLNNSNLNPEKLKENIDNNILEEFLKELISNTLLRLEIENLNILMTDKSLKEKIIKSNFFLDDDKKFSRVKYEKFLISNNITAGYYESEFKKNELKRELFNYISGGVKSPFFITNSVYKDQRKKLDIEFINLSNAYKKEGDFSSAEIKLFVEENKTKLEEEFIDFSYVKITPENLIGSTEYNELFFQKIDEIENKTLNAVNFKVIIDEINLEPVVKKNFIKNNLENNIENKIYEKRNESKSQIIEENDFFVLYQINKISKVLPSIENDNSKKKILKVLYEKSKYEYNQKLLNNIRENKFNESNFLKISNDNSIEIKKIKLDSINDTKKFDTDSVKLLYAMPKKSFLLIADEKKNIYVAKIIESYYENIQKSSDEFNLYEREAKINLVNNINTSYDFFLNDKYEIKINQKTLERVKNYFK